MNKNNFTSVNLGKGEMHVYDFGGVKLHAYKTNDFITDEVFIVEKNGVCVVIESPCFFDNNAELEKYLAGKEVAGMLIAYHDAGGSFLPHVRKYATTSHYTPEDLKDAQTKIDYLNELKRIAKGCKTAYEFKAEVKARFPAYGGENYLDMTAGMFFA